MTFIQVHWNGVFWSGGAISRSWLNGSYAYFVPPGQSCPLPIMGDAFKSA